MPKIGDTRIMAEWCYEQGVDEHGDSCLDLNKYEIAGPFDTIEQAIKHAEKHDVFGEGRAIVERYERVTRELGQWEEVEWHNEYGRL